jgi:dihydroorotase
VGERADVAIIDLDAVWTVDPGAFLSKGKNTPFAGREVTGRVMMTIVSGRIVYREGAVV